MAKKNAAASISSGADADTEITPNVGEAPIPAPDAPTQEPGSDLPPVQYATAEGAPPDGPIVVTDGGTIGVEPSQRASIEAIAPDLATIQDTSDPPAEPAPKPPPWRVVALCLEGCKVYFGDHLCDVVGGEWVTDTMRVRVVARDPHFHLFDVESAEHLAELMADHADEVRRVTERARSLGLVVYPHGTPKLPRR